MDILCWEDVSAPSAAASQLQQTLNQEQGQAKRKQQQAVRPPRSETVRSWKARCPLDPGNPDFGSWLAMLPGNRKLGCLACQWLLPGGRVRFSNLRRHGRTHLHERNVTKLLGRPPAACDGAPQLEFFKCVLEDRRKGLSLRTSSKESATGLLGGREKVLRATWCLGEAAAEEDRRFFRLPDIVIAIHQDVRKSTLCARYAAVSAQKMQFRRGVLGLVEDCGSSAPDLATATKIMYKEMCTPFFAAPRRHKLSVPPCCDSGLLHKMLAETELFAADAATDEQKAARILAGKSLPAATFPNLKAVIKDKTHAMTR